MAGSTVLSAPQVDPQLGKRIFLSQVPVFLKGWLPSQAWLVLLVLAMKVQTCPWICFHFSHCWMSAILKSTTPKLEPKYRLPIWGARANGKHCRTSPGTLDEMGKQTPTNLETKLGQQRIQKTAETREWQAGSCCTLRTQRNFLLLDILLIKHVQGKWHQAQALHQGDRVFQSPSQTLYLPDAVNKDPEGSTFPRAFCSLADQPVSRTVHLA